MRKRQTAQSNTKYCSRREIGIIDSLSVVLRRSGYGLNGDR